MNKYMERRKRSLLGRVEELDAKKLDLEQELAHREAERPFREMAEERQNLETKNLIARAAFLLKFGEVPKIVGTSMNAPVFAIEYANLLFDEGPSGMLGAKLVGQNPFKTRVFRKNFSRNERKILDEYSYKIHYSNFDPVCLCSECQNWGDLGYFVSHGPDRILSIESPAIDEYDDLVKNIDLFNEGASGLALDCGTVSVFGLDASKTSVAIGCDNLQQVVIEENDRRLPKNKDASTYALNTLSTRALRSMGIVRRKIQ